MFNGFPLAHQIVTNTVSSYFLPVRKKIVIFKCRKLFYKVRQKWCFYVSSSHSSRLKYKC